MTSVNQYFELFQMIERLHRRFLDVLKVELDKKSILDINNVQCMLLYNIGESEMTVGEITLRGYYLGSNVSYNLKKIVEHGYLIQEKSVHDKRSSRVKLSEKGRNLITVMDEIFTSQVEGLSKTPLSEADISNMKSAFLNLEKFLTSQASFTGL